MNNNYQLEYPENIFPFPDDKWQKVNNVCNNSNIDKKHIWKWYDDRERLCLVTYRTNNKEGEDKSQFPIAYGYTKDKKLGYDRTLLDWKYNKPIFNIPKILNDTESTIGIFEGEKTVSAAESHYPKLISTCYLGGVGNWNNSDWEILKNRKVILFPDNDTSGQNGFLSLAYYLKKELNCKVKSVCVPDTFPKKWDVADPLPKDTKHTYKSLLESAEDVADPIYFNNLKEDLAQRRFIIIEDSNGKQFYDRFQRRLLHKDLINLLYQADKEVKSLATNAIAASSPQRIRSTAFKRISKDIIEIEGDKYLNTYYPVRFEPLVHSEAETIKKDIEPWTKHLMMIFNGSVTSKENFESTMAHDLQKPNYNRTTGWLLQSSQGVGKGIIFSVIKKLNGEKNVAHVSSDMLVDRYRNYLRTTDMIMCTEIELTGRDVKSKMNKLKELISEEVHPIEEKFIPTNYHHGHFKLYLSSNAKVPVKLEERDRRFSFNQTLKTKSEILKDDPDYFKNLWAFINDKNNIRLLYHYYCHEYKIPESYDPHEPLENQARKGLMKFSRPQVYLDLDYYLDLAENNQRGTFFESKCDFINTRKLINDIRAWEQERAGIHKGYKRIFDGATEPVLNNWLGMLNAKPLKNGRPINIDNTGKKHWWAIRNKDYWSGREELFELRLHIQGKNPAPTDLLAFAENKKEVIND